MEGRGGILERTIYCIDGENQETGRGEEKMKKGQPDRLPANILSGRVYKVIQECSELLKRLQQKASREESWSIVLFVTGEAFELKNGRLRRCR